MSQVLTISVGLLATTTSQETFTLYVDETLTIEVQPEGPSVSRVQMEKIAFVPELEVLPSASFALAAGQAAPPGIAWHWARLKNGGVAAGEYTLEISGSMAETPQVWLVSVALTISVEAAPAEARAGAHPEMDAGDHGMLELDPEEDMEPAFVEHPLQVTVLSTDGRALTSHSSTIFNLAFDPSTHAGDLLKVTFAPAQGLGLSHPGLTRFYFNDSLTGRTVSDYGLAVMTRMPPGITIPQIAFRNNGSDSAAHYQVYFFGTVRNLDPEGPEILGWLSDPELVVRTTGLLGGAIASRKPPTNQE